VKDLIAKLNQGLVIMYIKIIKDCCCEHDIHEITRYPREGLTVQEFKKDQELEVIDKWSNFYGTYYRCKTGKGHADIAIDNAFIL